MSERSHARGRHEGSGSMRTRYTFDGNTGLLTDRDGNTLGRVVSITIDDQPEPTTERLGYGVSRCESLSTVDPSASKSTNVEPHTPRKTATQLEGEAVKRVWDYWLEISGKKQRLDSKRERIIRNALRLVGEDAVKRALLGLTRSPHHQGQNEQRKTYLEIRYALKGIGDESDDERIEKAISWAAMYAPDSQQLDEAKVQRYLEDVRYTLSQPHRPERERGVESYRKLLAAGFKVLQLNKAPWARLER